MALDLNQLSVNVSRPFILRPVGTTLLAIGLLLAGIISYRFLAVSSLPSVEIPTIRVSASRPGADPETMAATVASPLERRLGQIAGITEMTSSSGAGSTRITLQFELSRSVDAAARDVQAAINAAMADLPSDMPTLPNARKANPNAIPVLTLALTSDTLPASEIYDAADSILAQRLSQVQGVAEVNISGAEQPAIRIKLDPTRLALLGLSAEEVRQAVVAANGLAPLGTIDGPTQLITIDTNAQITSLDAYRRLIVRSRGGAVVRLADVADVEQGTRNTRSSALFNLKPAVILFITKQADANVIETVDAVKALIPELQRWIPAGIKISVVADRTQTIRASIHDMERTLILSVVLVMLVVFVFLRRLATTVAAGVTVPLSLAGTVALMWLFGFSVNNLTLMALAIAVGFVVDDAIVMIENTMRNRERGMPALEAALEGARQIGFTIIAISLSLIAAFIPLLFMGGVVGRFLREFSVTMVFAIVVSTIVSLTVTPMIMARFARPPTARPNRFDRAVEAVLAPIQRGYARTLDLALRYRWVTTLVMLATVALTAHLYVKIPKGMFPQDDTGLIWAGMQASPDTSFEQMNDLQRRAVERVLADPAVAAVSSSVGASFFSVTPNNGRMFIALKPIEERSGLTSAQVADRLRRPLNGVVGLRVSLWPIQDFSVGGRQSNASLQLTVWSDDYDDVVTWAPKVADALRAVPGIEDVGTDREVGGMSYDITLDRLAMARLGVRTQDVNAALANAFTQRQISIIYGARNQYRVILEVDPRLQRDPGDLDRLFVPGRDGRQIALSSLITTSRGLMPLSVNHQGPFPAITVSYNIKAEASLDLVQQDITRAVAALAIPDTLRVEPAGNARAAITGASSQTLLILAALLAVYIVLGVLYESFAHPLTILSTLPSAGLGALIALQLGGMEFSMVAFIGVIMLIGIVKKNGIMLVDFALEAERSRGLTAHDAIREACIVRFRPILMTTLAALLGAIPLALAAGPGAGMRTPLGVTIIGGLIVSQMLTLYTTPVIYLALDRLHRRLWGRADAAPPRTIVQPAE